ncbi:MAG: YigZ family protein, partial [Muribaculaceae bacterium]|nr:YigZ family protein [Muribaculaceae bacterium]
MADTFYTISTPGEGIYKEKMSKFIAFAIPASSAAEAKSIVSTYANKYHDARHVCWAYMIGPGRDEYLSSDNGEPSGTAGKPILGQINSHNLTNIVVIVVRYFGGIKLGTSGLITAYREAARLAIG